MFSSASSKKAENKREQCVIGTKNRLTRKTQGCSHCKVFKAHFGNKKKVEPKELLAVQFLSYSLTIIPRALARGIILLF